MNNLIGTIDLCLFDIDYTLVSGKRAEFYYSCYSRLIEKIYAKKFNISYKKARQMVDKFRKENNGQGELILDKYNLQWAWYDEILNLNPAEFLRPDSNLVKLLNILKENKIMLGAITNSPIGQINKLFNAIGINSQLFNIIIGWEKNGEKPKNGSPKIFFNVCKNAGVNPAKTVMVGDSLITDVIPALKAGCKAVLFDPKNKSQKNKNYYIVSSLRDLLYLNIKKGEK